MYTQNDSTTSSVVGEYTPLFPKQIVDWESLLSMVAWPAELAASVLLNYDPEFTRYLADSLRFQARITVRSVNLDLPWIDRNAAWKFYEDVANHTQLIVETSQKIKLAEKTGYLPVVLPKHLVPNQHRSLALKANKVFIPITVIAWAIHSGLSIPRELIKFAEGIRVISEQERIDLLSQDYWPWYQAIYYVCGLFPHDNPSQNTVYRHFPLLAGCFFQLAQKSDCILKKQQFSSNQNEMLPPYEWVNFFEKITLKNIKSSKNNSKQSTIEWRGRAVELGIKYTQDFIESKKEKTYNQENIAIHYKVFV